MLFRAKFDTVSGEQQSKELMFVGYYASCPLEEADRELDLSLRHLVGEVWEEMSVKHGKTTRKEPYYAVIQHSPVLQQDCVCPHFQPWNEDRGHHFLVNAF